MAYLTAADIANFTSYAMKDFKDAGVEMNATKFSSLISLVIAVTDQTINRYCGVASLEEHTVTEYFSGSGPSGDYVANGVSGYAGILTAYANSYLPSDTDFHLYERCISVASVAEDMSPYGIPQWVSKAERTSVATGDFNVWTENEVTTISFIRNIPLIGRHNLRVIYNAGYASGSPELEALRYIALRIAINMLKYKKKIQEATTIRAAGVEDYSKMFDVPSDRLITNDIARDLMKYRRWRFASSNS
jgi:hypothetical protein